MSDLRFQWDPRKAAGNVRKHGVSFEEAATVFNDLACDVEESIGRSDHEERFKAIGFSKRNRLLAVIFTETNDAIRIISAWEADTAEEAAYAEHLR